MSAVNPITIGLDLLLALLLLTALAMGARLNSRLKALRASHESFAKAVGELDAAAHRADRALKGLHAASEEAHDSLLARIETARALVVKLEKAGEAAEKSAARADDVISRAALAPAAAPAAPRRSIADLIAVHTPRAAAPAPESRRASPPAAPPAPRRRPVADEDLFAEAEGGVRPELSGLMRMSLARSR
jgi:hypothetical protein